MFKYITNPLRSTVTALLRTYLSKFVVGIRDFDDTVESGDIVLRNLALRTDVIQRSLRGFPLTVLSAAVGELHISIPWTALGSQPIQITLKRCNVVVVVDENGENNKSKPKSGGSAKSPGSAETEWISWLESYAGQIICNVGFQIEQLVITMIFDETPVEVSIGSCGITSANSSRGQWMSPAFISLARPDFTIHKSVSIKDVSVHFTQDSSGEGRPSSLMSVTSLEGRTKIDLLPGLGTIAQASRFAATLSPTSNEQVARLASHIKFRPHVIVDARIDSIALHFDERRDLEPLLCCIRVLDRVSGGKRDRNEADGVRAGQRPTLVPRAAGLWKCSLKAHLNRLSAKLTTCDWCDAQRARCKPAQSRTLTVGVVMESITGHARCGILKASKASVFTDFGVMMTALSCAVTSSGEHGDDEDIAKLKLGSGVRPSQSSSYSIEDELFVSATGVPQWSSVRPTAGSSQAAPESPGASAVQVNIVYLNNKNASQTRKVPDLEPFLKSSVVFGDLNITVLESSLLVSRLLTAQRSTLITAIANCPLAIAKHDVSHRLAEKPRRRRPLLHFLDCHVAASSVQILCCAPLPDQCSSSQFRFQIDKIKAVVCKMSMEVSTRRCQCDITHHNKAGRAKICAEVSSFNANLPLAHPNKFRSINGLDPASVVAAHFVAGSTRIIFVSENADDVDSIVVLECLSFHDEASKRKNFFKSPSFSYCPIASHRLEQLAIEKSTNFLKLRCGMNGTPVQPTCSDHSVDTIVEVSLDVVPSIVSISLHLDVLNFAAQIAKSIQQSWDAHRPTKQSTLPDGGASDNRKFKAISKDQACHIDFKLRGSSTAFVVQVPGVSDPIKQVPDATADGFCATLYGADVELYQSLRDPTYRVSMALGVVELVYCGCRTFAPIYHQRQFSCSIVRDYAVGFEILAGFNSSRLQTPRGSSTSCVWCERLQPKFLPLLGLLATLSVQTECNVSASLSLALLHSCESTASAMRAPLKQIFTELNMLTRPIHSHDSLRPTNVVRVTKSAKGVVVVPIRHSLAEWKRTNAAKAQELAERQYTCNTSFSSTPETASDHMFPAISWCYSQPSYVCGVDFDPLADILPVITESIPVSKSQQIYLHFILQHLDEHVPGEDAVFQTVAKTVVLCKAHQLSSQQFWDVSQTLVIPRDLRPVSRVWQLQWFVTVADVSKAINALEATARFHAPVFLDSTCANICTMQIAASMSIRACHFACGSTRLPIARPRPDSTVLLRKRVSVQLSIGSISIQLLQTQYPDFTHYGENLRRATLLLSCRDVNVGLSFFCSRSFVDKSKSQHTHLPAQRTPHRLMRGCVRMICSASILNDISASFETILPDSPIQLRMLQSLGDINPHPSEATSYIVPNRHSRVRLSLPSGLRLSFSERLLCHLSAWVMAPFNGSNKLPLRNSEMAVQQTSKAIPEINFRHGCEIFNHTDSDLLILQQHLTSSPNAAKHSLIPLHAESHRRFVFPSVDLNHSLTQCCLRLSQAPRQSESNFGGDLAEFISSVQCSRGLKLLWSDKVLFPLQNVGSSKRFSDELGREGYWVKKWKAGELFDHPNALNCLPSELRRFAAHIPMNYQPHGCHQAGAGHQLQVPYCLAADDDKRRLCVMVTVTYTSCGVAVHITSPDVFCNHTRLQFHLAPPPTPDSPPRDVDVVRPRGVLWRRVLVSDDQLHKSDDGLRHMQLYALDGDESVMLEAHRIRLANGVPSITRAGGHRGSVSDKLRPGYLSGVLCVGPRRIFSNQILSGSYCMLGLDVIITSKCVRLSHCLFHDAVSGEVDIAHWGIGALLSEPVSRQSVQLFCDETTVYGLETAHAEDAVDFDDAVRSHIIVARVTFHNSVINTQTSVSYHPIAPNIDPQTAVLDRRIEIQRSINALSAIKVSCTICGPKCDECPHLQGFQSVPVAVQQLHGHISELHVETSTSDGSKGMPLTFHSVPVVLSGISQERKFGVATVETTHQESAVASIALNLKAPIAVTSEVVGLSVVLCFSRTRGEPSSGDCCFVTVPPLQTINLFVTAHNFPMVKLKVVGGMKYSWSEWLDIRHILRPSLIACEVDDESQGSSASGHNRALPFLLHRTGHLSACSLTLCAAASVQSVPRDQLNLPFVDVVTQRHLFVESDENERASAQLHCLVETHGQHVRSRVMHFTWKIGDTVFQFEINDDHRSGGSGSLSCKDPWCRLSTSKGQSKRVIKAKQTLQCAFSLMATFPQVTEQHTTTYSAAWHGPGNARSVLKHVKSTDFSTYATQDQCGRVVVHMEQRRLPSLTVRNFTNFSLLLRRKPCGEGPEKWDKLDVGAAFTKSWLAPHLRGSGADNVNIGIFDRTSTGGIPAFVDNTDCCVCAAISPECQPARTSEPPTANAQKPRWSRWLSIPKSRKSATSNGFADGEPDLLAKRVGSQDGSEDGGYDSGRGTLQYTEFFSLDTRPVESTARNIAEETCKFQLIHQNILGLDVIDIVQLGSDGDTLSSDVHCSNHFERTDSGVHNNFRRPPIGFECYIKLLSVTWRDDCGGSIQLHGQRTSSTALATPVLGCCWNVTDLYGFMKWDRSVVHGTNLFGCSGTIKLLSSQFVYFRRTMKRRSNNELHQANSDTEVAAPVVVLNVQSQRRRDFEDAAVDRLCIPSSRGTLFRADTSFFMLSRGVLCVTCFVASVFALL